MLSSIKISLAIRVSLLLVFLHGSWTVNKTLSQHRLTGLDASSKDIFNTHLMYYWRKALTARKPSRSFQTPGSGFCASLSTNDLRTCSQYFPVLEQVDTLFKLIFISLCVLLCAYVCKRWKSEDNMWDSAFSFYHMDSRSKSGPRVHLQVPLPTEPSFCLWFCVLD